MSTPPPKPPHTELERLMQGLWQDAEIGDLGRSRHRLTMRDPLTARRAVVHLGIPYLQKIKALGRKALLDDLQGKAAIARYVDDTLKPIVASKPAVPPASRKQPSAAVKQKQKSALRRGVSRLAVTALLGISLITTGTYLHLSQSAGPEPIATPVVTNIVELRQEFNRTALGRDLLKMADDNGITIDYDATLSDRKRYAEYSAASKRATLRPDLSTDDQLIYLAHELRHAWQDIVLGYDEMEDRMLTPAQKWTLRRFVEADAAAFSTVFLAERMRDMHQTERPDNSTAHSEYTFARALLAEYASPDGLTHAEYRAQILKESFESLSSYDPQHLSLAIHSTVGITNLVKQAQLYIDTGQFTHAQIVLNHLDSAFASTPTDKEFETWLRQMGGTSLDPNIQTALQDPAVKPQELFNNYAALGSASTGLPAPSTLSDTASHVQQVKTASAIHDALRNMTTHLKELNHINKQIAELKQRVPKPPAAHGSKATL